MAGTTTTKKSSLPTHDASGGFTTASGKYVSGTSTAAQNSMKSLGISRSSSDPGYDSSSYRNSISALSRELAAQRSALAERQARAEANINSDYNIAKLGLEKTQERDYAGRATSLVTSGGGFLGATQSQEGVLQNLKGTFEAEKNALLSKKEEALLASQSAYEDKDFALSTKMLELAKDAEKEMYQRTQDYTNNVLKINQENRAQTEFDMGLTEKKAQAYAMMDDSQYSQLTPQQKADAETGFFPGYLDAKRKIEKQLLSKNEIGAKTDLQQLINLTPRGQKITLSNGQTYVGTKSPDGSKITDPIPQFIAEQLGLPQIAGQSQADMILSLGLANPPAWYKQYYKNSNPSGWAVAKNRPDIVKNEWTFFRNQPEFTPFKNTVQIDKVTSKNDLSSLLGPINPNVMTQMFQEAGLE